jgi:predicted enzyme related to lactoylglutathione lyase
VAYRSRRGRQPHLGGSFTVACIVWFAWSVTSTASWVHHIQQRGNIMAEAAQLIVYPVKDLEKTKDQFTQLLGSDPYVDGPYYVGYRTEGREIGLDPHGSSSGPIAYWETEDIAARVDELRSAGWQVASDAKDVGGGLLVAQLTDSNGNTIGLRQNA